MAGVAGACIAVEEIQPAIGEYVQDDLAINGATNMIGVDLLKSWQTNVMGILVTDNFVAPSTYEAAPILDAQWCVAGDAIACNAVCTIADGVATDGGAGGWQCLVTDGVVAGDYFWAHISGE